MYNLALSDSSGTTVLKLPLRSKSIFKDNIESKSDTRVIYEMVITFILMISFLYYLHKYLDTIPMPFDTGKLDKDSVMFTCEIIAATLFTYTSKLNEKVDKFFETKNEFPIVFA